MGVVSPSVNFNYTDDAGSWVFKMLFIRCSEVIPYLKPSEMVIKQ